MCTVHQAQIMQDLSQQLYCSAATGPTRIFFFFFLKQHSTDAVMQLASFLRVPRDGDAFIRYTVHDGVDLLPSQQQQHLLHDHCRTNVSLHR